VAAHVIIVLIIRAVGARKRLGMIMSTVLTRGVRHEAQEILPARANEQPKVEGASSQMVVFACIWAAVIAYFALQAALN
jgi:hypothetical protein